MLAQSNLLSDLNLNRNLNPETMLHDDMYNVKNRQTDILYELVLFEQIRVSFTFFRVTSFIDFVPYLESFNFLKKYIEKLKTS